MKVPGSRFKAIIFDFDGLIVDTELPEYLSWSEIYQSFGQVLELQKWTMGIGTRNGFDPYLLLEELTGKTVNREAIRSIRRPRYVELLQDLRLLDGVQFWLTEARHLGMLIGLASSSDADWIGEHLDRYGLSRSFDAIRCAGGSIKAKPAPDLYLRVLEDLGIVAGEAVALEDSPHGIAAAKAAGLYCIAVPNQITASLDLSEADLVVTSLATFPISRLIET